MKTETVNPNEIQVADTIVIGGELHTVGKDTLKNDFFGTTVHGVRMKTVERVLFPKFFSGEFLGFVSQP